MPHPNAIDPWWTVQWCPFCHMTLTFNRDDWVTESPAIEQVWEEHLAEHVEEMMAVAP